MRNFLGISDVNGRAVNVSGAWVNHARIVFAAVIVAIVGAFPSRADAQGGTIAITSVTVIDGTGSAARSDMTVIVRGGRIIAVDPAATAQAPADAVVIDGRGKFLIPGLWDMHVHLAKAGAGSLALLVANGVTSVRDMGGDAALLRTWRDDIEAGRRLGPRMKWAGPMLESPERIARMRKGGTHEPIDRFRAAVADPASAERVVDSIARLGVDFIKLRTVASDETYRAIAAAAARHGLSLVGHASDVPFEEVLKAGQKSVEHTVYPSLQQRSPKDRAKLIAAMARRNIALVPTAVSYYESIDLPASRMRRMMDDSLGVTDPRRRYIDGYLLQDWREQLDERPGGLRASIQGAVVGQIHKAAVQDAKEMRRAGVRVLPGSDLAVIGIYPGSSLHDELRLFVQKLGMTPMEALVSATRQPAEFFGMQDSLGTIEANRIADLVLLDADPLADIRNVRRIDAVILRGRLLDRPALEKLTDPRTARTSGR
jgi:imidazolonepropionase-like amidohydrolase